MGDLSSLLGGIDPGMIAKLLPVLSQLNRPESGETAAFLRALRPFLKPERQDKVERAAQLARFIHLGKTLLLSEGGRAMYNRYLRNDDGVYTRMPMQDAPRGEPPRDNRPPPRRPPAETHRRQGRRRGRSPPPPISQEASQFFSRILDKLPLKGVDTADILLLLILFFLFEEKADDELLVALGLLLIL